MGCETHLDSSYFTSEVFPPNFAVYRKDRSIGSGGVFVAIKGDLTSLHEPILNISAELVCAKVSLVGTRPLYICSYYRQPNSELESLFELKKFLYSFLNKRSGPPYFVLAGDFNLPDIN